MRLPRTKIKKLEREIINAKKELAKSEYKLLDYLKTKKQKFTPEMFELLNKYYKSDLIHEIDKLESERKHIIDSRDSLMWRFIWNVVIPILVSIATTFVIANYFSLI